jgi:hypothetical protein
MKFSDVTAEAIDYRVKFYYRYDRRNVVNGYTVERETDGIKAGMLHIQGRKWSSVFGKERFEGTLANAANWALDKVANADPA